jgi:hypothetical protein
LARVAQLEARERAQQTTLEEIRASIIDEAEELLSVVGRRCPDAIKLLERLLMLATNTSVVD